MDAWVRNVIAVILCALVWSCGGGIAPQPETVSLPIPFGGAFNGDSTLVVADGNPVSASTSLGTVKFQEASSNDISWQIFNSTTGKLRGTLTFQPATMTPPIISGTGPDINREYFISMRANFEQQKQLNVSRFQCFERASTLPPPTFDPRTVAPNDPNPVAVTREMACAGISDSGSEGVPLNQPIEGRFVMGMVQLSNGDFLFHTQIKSALFLAGSGAFAEASGPDDEVLFSVVAEGFGTHLTGVEGQLLNPIYLPGEISSQGIEVDTVVEFIEVSSERFEVVVNLQLNFGNARLFVPRVRFREQAVPELSPILADVIQDRFIEGVHYSASLIENGIAFLTVVGEEGPDHDPINCEEQAGIFRDLCEQFGPLKLNYRCLIFLDENTFQVYVFHGSYILSRDNDS